MGPSLLGVMEVLGNVRKQAKQSVGSKQVGSNNFPHLSDCLEFLPWHQFMMDCYTTLWNKIKLHLKLCFLTALEIPNGRDVVKEKMPLRRKADSEQEENLVPTVRPVSKTRKYQRFFLEIKADKSFEEIETDTRAWQTPLESFSESESRSLCKLTSLLGDLGQRKSAMTYRPRQNGYLNRH